MIQLRETPVNHGQYYPANYDKPHDVTSSRQFQGESPLKLINECKL